MPALDAYARKATLAEDLGTAQYTQLMEARVRSVRGDSGASDAVPDRSIYDGAASGAQVVKVMQTAVDTGYTFYVAPHMDALVSAAADSLPEDDVLNVHDLPTPQGFLWIPGGLTVLDIKGRVLKYNAALWTSYGGEAFVWWLTDKYDDGDTTNLEIRQTASDQAWAQFPTLTPNGESRIRFGGPLPKAVAATKVLPPEVRSSMYWDPKQGLVMAWDHGYTAEEIQEWIRPSAGPDPAVSWLLACWRLMQQSVARLDDVEMPRQIRKLGRRAGLPSDYVTVINLRSKPSRGDGESAVSWSHRWLRRGHWRQQPYKEDGVWVRKTIWIHPTVCGPEGLPLVIKDHVYNLTR